MTEVAVVILNYNGRNFLKQFLPSVIQYSGQAKIIVADNASTDDSIQLIESEFSPRVEILKMDINRGYCGGYNYALDKIDASFFVLLNSDVEVTEGWIEPIIKHFKRDNSIAAVQPKILSHQEKNKFEYAGAAGGYIDRLGYPFCRGRIFSHLEEDHGQYDDVRQIFWASGACLFIRSDDFKKSGGFDESFFAHMEEIDLCWRLNRSGHKVFYEGKSKVYHVGGGTLAVSNPKKTYLNFRNGLSLLIKNLPAMELLWKLPMRILLDWLAAFVFLLSGKPADFIAVIKAHLSFFGSIDKDFDKRKITMGSQFNKKLEGQFFSLLPFQFFVLRRKNFGELR